MFTIPDRKYLKEDRFIFTQDFTHKGSGPPSQGRHWWNLSGHGGRNMWWKILMS